MQIYVSASVKRSGDGSQAAPFQTINEAAQVAVAGDEVIVLPGYYREWVDPKNGGTADDCRITYRSQVPGGAVITGSEVVKTWEPYQGDVWVARIPNGLFGNYNPYTTLIEGDWYIPSKPFHTGEVYLNGKSMYEAEDLEGVLQPQEYKSSWDRAFTIYRWYTCQEDGNTVLYANFHGANPNEENVEINVRRNCFYPSKTGVNYITLSGFVVRQAATQWAPPTAYQEGMIGPHWSKGWIIEDCEVSDSKCSGISLGKFLQPENDNKWLKTKYKDGTQTERECICLAQIQGWTKENIGHHIIRRCNIHDCGQTGIVGNLGGVLSIIEDHHNHPINTKPNLSGAEIGGIKMHAAIDVIFRRNHIHHCTRGIWLDWQAQGTRVTQNLFHHNTLPTLSENPDKEEFLGIGDDIFVEVSHGPTLIDNNILLSTRSLKLAAQGIAVVHNLIGGALTCVGRGTDNGAKTLSSSRYTPYHVAHRTEVMGFMTFLHGDMRFYNNIFVQQDVHPALVKMCEFAKEHYNEWDDNNVEVGTFKYNGYPTFEEWDKQFEGYCGMGSEPSDRYYSHLPVWSEGNVYFGGAQPWDKEKDAKVVPEKVTLNLREEDGKYTLETNLYELLPEVKAPAVPPSCWAPPLSPKRSLRTPTAPPLCSTRTTLAATGPSTPCPGPLSPRKSSRKPCFERKPDPAPHWPHPHGVPGEIRHTPAKRPGGGAAGRGGV